MGKRGRGAASGADDGNHVDEAEADFVAASSSRHEVRGSPSRPALATAAMGTRGAAAASGADDGNPAEQPPQAHALSDEQILAQLDRLERKLLSLQGAIRDLRVQVQARSEGHATHAHVSDRRSGAGADSDPPRGFHYVGRLRFPKTPPDSPRRPATLADNGPAAIVVSDSPATLAGGPASPDVHDDLSPTSPGSQSYLNSTCSTLPYA